MNPPDSEVPAPGDLPASERGWFITFEGIDGAGKSSHIGAAAEMLKAQGHTVVLTREPGGTQLAEKLRALVLNDSMDPLTEALLMFAARREHLVTVIEPALARGDVVISDRFTDATFAYQGGGRGFDWHVLTQLEHMVQQRAYGQAIRQPDLTLWFDLPPEVAAQRLAGARAPDKFEAESVSFFARVQSGYARRAAEHPHRFVGIAADQPMADVAHAVLHAVQRASQLRGNHPEASRGESV
jgi:dTMP kinase